MALLITTAADDAVQLQRDLERALSGGPALGLGMLGDQPDEVDDGTAVVIGTSGSTGIPKRVVLSAEALRAGAEATAARIGSGRWLLALPAGYVAGLQVLVRSILSGTSPAVLEDGFSPRAFAEATLAMPASTPRFTSLVPAQIATLLDAADDTPVLAALQAYDA
ncbi:MAG: AMP-binding protein, partial [Microbacterium sp.]